MMAVLPRNFGGTEILQGTGSPEGTVTALPGKLYVSDAGGVGETLYVKETGTGNTGWRAYGVDEILKGTGSPEGSVTAVPGKLYTDTDGGTGETLYIKESGTGNTGWVAVAPGSGSTLTDAQVRAAAIPNAIVIIRGNAVVYDGTSSNPTTAGNNFKTALGQLQSGDIMVCGPGTFECTAATLAASNVKLFCSGTRLKSNAAYDFILRITGNNVEVRGLTVDGGGVANTPPSGNNANGISVSGDDVSLFDCAANGIMAAISGFGNGLFAFDCNNLLVDGFYSEKCFYAGWILTDTPVATLKNIRVVNPRNRVGATRSTATVHRIIIDGLYGYTSEDVGGQVLFGSIDINHSSSVGSPGRCEEFVLRNVHLKTEDLFNDASPRNLLKVQGVDRLVLDTVTLEQFPNAGSGTSASLWFESAAQESVKEMYAKALTCYGYATFNSNPIEIIDWEDCHFGVRYTEGTQVIWNLAAKKLNCRRCTFNCHGTTRAITTVDPFESTWTWSFTDCEFRGNRNDTFCYVMQGNAIRTAPGRVIFAGNRLINYGTQAFYVTNIREANLVLDTDRNGNMLWRASKASSTTSYDKQPVAGSAPNYFSTLAAAPVGTRIINVEKQTTGSSLPRYWESDGTNWKAAPDSGGSVSTVNDIVALPDVATMQLLGSPIDDQLYQTAGYSQQGIGANLYRYDATSTATADGGFVINATGAGVGRYIAVDQTVADVTKFGAVPGGGAAANQTAFEAAVSSAGIGGHVHIPFGDFDLNSQLTLLERQTLSGVGQYSRMHWVTNDNTYCILAARFCILKDFRVQGNGAADGKVGIAIVGTEAATVDRGRAENVRVISVQTGVAFNGCFLWDFTDCYIEGCGYGYHFGYGWLDAEIETCNAINIRGGEVVGCIEGVRFNGQGNNINILGVTIEGCTSYGIHAVTDNTAAWNSCSVDYCYFELNTTAHIYLEDFCNYWTIKSNYFQAQGVSTCKPIILGDPAGAAGRPFGTHIENNVYKGTTVEATTIEINAECVRTVLIYDKTQFIDVLTGGNIVDNATTSIIRQMDIAYGNLTATAVNTDATPTVKNIDRLTVQNAVATTITRFDNGKAGQSLTVHINDANTSINATSDIVLDASEGNYAAQAGGAIFQFFTPDGLVWYEVSRRVF